MHSPLQIRMVRLGAGILLGAALSLGGVTASAEDAPLTDREKALMDMIEKLEARVEALEKQAPPASPALEERVATIEEQVKEREADPSDMRVYWKGGVRMETEDGQFKLRLGGRIHNDWAWFDQDRDLERRFGNSQDGVEFRRARLYLSGLLYDNIEFKAQYDFADGDADFKDVYIGMGGLPLVGNVRIGQFKEPFSLEELISSNYTTFLERGLPNALVPSRNTGVMLHDQALEGRMAWALGVFRTVDDYGNGSDDGDYAITARLSGLPWYADEGRKLVHLGAAYSHRPRNGALRISARPEAHLSDFRFVDTGTFESEDMDLYGLEAALKYGPFSLQGEYIAADVDSVRRTVLTNFTWRDQDDVTFDGYYVAASYLLTGEDRPYDMEDGVFGRIKPNRNFSLNGGGWGAFELALRFSNIDLEDGMIYGGEEDNWSVGLNWYLNPNTRVMLNYIRADVDRSVPLSTTGLFRRGYEGEVDIVQSRFQVDF